MHLRIWHIIGRNVLHNVTCEISSSRLTIFDLNTALLINTAKKSYILDNVQQVLHP